jgi:hypothetical protein
MQWSSPLSPAYLRATTDGSSTFPTDRVAHASTTLMYHCLNCTSKMFSGRWTNKLIRWRLDRSRLGGLGTAHCSSRCCSHPSMEVKHYLTCVSSVPGRSVGCGF